MAVGTQREVLSEQIAERVRAQMAGAFDELAALVAMRSVADPRQEPPEECRRAGEAVRDAFAAAGVPSVDLVETPDGSSSVIGHRPAPPGAPTVLLYSHYDVQPAGPPSAWTSPPWTLTERDGRWYGRGAADCKGNVVMHLLALRALREVLGEDLPVGVRVVVEGSEEMGGAGLERLVEHHPELVRPSDVVVIGDCGNVEVGVPTVTTALRGMASVVLTVETLEGAVHSGMYGGAAPDALSCLIAALATLQTPDGRPTIDGLPADGRWDGAGWPEGRFRIEAGVLDGVRLAGSGADGSAASTVADRVWARPSVTVVGIDAPPVVGSAAAVVPRASARVGIRIPPGTDPQHAQDLLVEHLERAVPLHARVSVERQAMGSPFRARTDGPAHAVISEAMAEVFGRPRVTAGQGGSIPLCTTLQRAMPAAEFLLLGVEEPACRIHAPDESVHPAEVERMALSEALLLSRLGSAATA